MMKTMKKLHFLIVFALTSLLFIACTSTTKKEDGKREVPDTETPESLTMTDVPVDRDFTQINNLSNLDIYWSEGAYSIRFEGNTMSLNDIDISVDDAGLTVNELQPITSELPARLHISSPTLTILSNYGSGTIHLTGMLQSDHLEIGNMQDGCIDADTLLCQTLKYTASDSATAHFGLIRGEEAALIADGKGSTDVTLDVRHLILHAWGSQTVTLNGHADKKEIDCSPTNTVNDLLK